MRVLIGLVVFLYATSCVSVADGEEAGELRMDKKLRERNGRYDVTELRKLAVKGRWAKYAGNPVLKPGANGQWDSWTLATMNVLKVGDTSHMYYEADRSNRPHLPRISPWASLPCWRSSSIRQFDKGIRP